MRTADAAKLLAGVTSMKGIMRAFAELATVFLGRAPAHERVPRAGGFFVGSSQTLADETLQKVANKGRTRIILCT